MLPATLPAKFRTRVRLEGECWVWTGTLAPSGHGRFYDRPGHRVYAHRFSYETLVGPIPEGLVVDHTCHTRAVERGECGGGPACPHRKCVNPAHLEPVTTKENTRRGMSGMSGSSRSWDEMMAKLRSISSV